MQRNPALPLSLALGLGALLALVGVGHGAADVPASDSARAPAHGTPSPAELLGRPHRQSPPGGYVDHHAPLVPWEARLVAGYRTPVRQ